MAAEAAILKGRDYALVQLSHRLMGLWRMLGEVEHDALARRLDEVRIDTPVFVSGLARSGTTMVLTLLERADAVATHRYRDFPFLCVPLAWNWLQDLLGGGAQEAVERPHRDRIRITKESAEAFEEPIWQAFFPWVHDPSRCHVMDAAQANAEFESFFSSHLRKILWLRGGRRYVSKGNYNLSRIEYLARVFPTARFVVPVRSPLSHVQSLVEQHALFCRYAKDDPRVPKYLAAAGHYEFGPQRLPTNFDRARVGEIEAAWREGDDYRGYARQWAQAYAHVDRLRDGPLGERIMVLRYEDFCAQPSTVASQILPAQRFRGPRGRPGGHRVRAHRAHAPAGRRRHGVARGPRRRRALRLRVKRIFVFNGDADGLCALQQLSLVEGSGDELVTGPKRRTRLLDGLTASAGDEVTVLDVSFHTNRADVLRLLEAGARVRYFDHHHAGELPAHERLEAHIDLSPKLCTSAIVDRYLNSKHRPWAAVGAYGDNLAATGRSLCDSSELEKLGVLLNYNSYGDAEADLFFPPAELHRRMAGYEDPLAFIREDEAYETLERGYAEDMAHAAALRPAMGLDNAVVYVLPDAPWARRVSGTLANRLARSAPTRAHALLSPNGAGGMQVSVRAPLERPAGAAALCLEYPGGGGREAAAGINHLPMDAVGAFAERFIQYFCRDSTHSAA